MGKGWSGLRGSEGGGAGPRLGELCQGMPGAPLLPPHNPSIGLSGHPRPAHDSPLLSNSSFSTLDTGGTDTPICWKLTSELESRLGRPVSKSLGATMSDCPDGWISWCPGHPVRTPRAFLGVLITRSPICPSMTLVRRSATVSPYSPQELVTNTSTTRGQGTGDRGQGTGGRHKKRHHVT